MGMLDRYKKKGGFVQLLTLIETSGKQKQEQFLTLIGQENPVWEQALRQKMLNLDRLLSWNPIYLGEVTARVQPLTLATVVAGLPEDKAALLLASLSASEKRKIQQVIDEKTPTPAEVSSCIMKLLGETRGFIMGGILKMDKVSPEMMIAENIEEQLNSAPAVAMRAEASAGESAEEGGEGLVFTLEGRNASSASAGNREEVDFLKRKVNNLTAENQALKHELSLLRGKLDQIRRIA